MPGLEMCRHSGMSPGPRAGHIRGSGRPSTWIAATHPIFSIAVSTIAKAWLGVSYSERVQRQRSDRLAAGPDKKGDPFYGAKTSKANEDMVNLSVSTDSSCAG